MPLQGGECFETFFENAICGIYRTTPDGRILAANPACVRMLGYETFEELAKRNLEEECRAFAPSHPRSQFKKRIEADGKVVGFESAWIRRDGTILYVRENAHAVRDGSGGFLYYEGTVEDITERKRAEEALRRNQSRLMRVVVGINDGMWERPDLSKDDLWWSPRFFELLGYEPDEFSPTIGRFIEMIHPDDRETQVERMRALPDSTESYEAQYRLRHKSGEYHWFHSKGKVFRDKAGRSISVSGSIRDISRQKLAEHELQSAHYFLRTVLDSFPDNVAVLDERGIIVMTNGAWLSFGCAKGLEAALQEAEVNYLDVIRSTADQSGEGVHQACEGIEAILRGERNEFRTEHLCRCPDRQRWFEWRVQGFSHEDRRWAVVAHLDITERKRAEDMLAERNRLLAEINALGIELASLPTGKDIRACVIERLMRMTGAKAAWFSDYDPNRKVLAVRCVKGGSGVLGKAAGLLGRGLETIRAPVSDEVYREIVANPVGVRKTLTEMSFGEIPRPVGAAIQALLGADHFIGLAHVIEGKLFGVSGLAMKADRPDPPVELLESAAHLVAVSLRRRFVEEELIRHKYIFDGVLASITDHVSILDWSLRFLYVSQSAAGVIGRPREEIVGTRWRDLGMPEDVMLPFERKVRGVLTTGKHCQGAVSYPAAQGLRQVEYVVSPVDLGTGEAPLALVVARDVTERREVEGRLLDYQRRLQALAVEATLAAERERHRIGLGLHDNVAQGLAMIKLSLQTLRAGADERAAGILARNCREIDALVEELRSLTFKLRSNVLYEVGLCEAVDAYLEQAIRSEHGLACDLQRSGDFSVLDADVKATLFRIFKELVTNVVKHAQAKRLFVRLECDGGTVVLEVKDDGRGIGDREFPIDGHRGHFGLFSVSEQIRAFGGTLDFPDKSEPGTCIRITAPVRCPSALR